MLELIFASLIVGWLVAAPDRHTLTATRGTAGAVRAATKAATRSVRSDFPRGKHRPGRSAARATAGAAAADAGQPVTDALTQSAQPPRMARLVRTVAQMTGRGAVVTAHAVRAAAVAAPAGWREGVYAARSRRYPELYPPIEAADAPAEAPATTEPAPVAPADQAAPGKEAVAKPSPATVPAARPGHRTTQGETVMDKSDVNEIAVTELATIDDLAREVADAQKVADVLERYASVLSTWAAQLGERYASAEFGTRALDDSLGELADQLGRTPQRSPGDELFLPVHGAIREARALGEEAAAVAAKGRVGAFQPQ